MAFDIATQTGVAFGPAGGTPRAVSVDLGKGLPEAQKFSRMLRLVDDFLTRHEPDLVVYEAAIGGANSSQYLIGLVGCLRGAAFNHRLDPKAVYLAGVRKHFIGKNLTSKDFPGLGSYAAKKEIKRVVVNRCRSLGWDVEDDNEADACAAWDYACATMAGVQARPGGLFDAARA
jgi:hypothetical protein